MRSVRALGIAVLAVLLFSSLATAVVARVTKGSLPSKTSADVTALLTKESAVQNDLRAFEKLGSSASITTSESKIKSDESAQSTAIATLNGDLVTKQKTSSSTSAPATTAPAKLTQQQQSARGEANQYLSTQAFSKQGLIDQLDSPDGGGYSVNDATVAVDSLTVNWNTEAVQAAKEYLKTQPFSCNDLIQQLDSPDGGQFTVAQATYGAHQAGDC